ncbi:MAG: DUF3307 domain-containing protein [Bacillota bacterium]|nr:DUF3307 domain-containing protein [Bacillota bacterium]MDP4161195.1 DUF3307 domain-containing protein [Bacillota bacterium]
MSPFDFLLLAHLIGDFPLQTSWMAMNKAEKWLPLLAHSTLYTAVIEIISLVGFGGLALWQLLVVLLAHVLLDRRKFVAWWVKKVMRTDLSGNGWLGIMVDQVFHVTILALIFQIM